MKVVDNVLCTILFDATIDIFLADIGNIGPDLGPRGAVDVLWTMRQHVFIANVCPNKSMIGLEAIDVMKGDEPTAQHCESWRCPDTVDRLSLFISSTCSQNTLTAVIADNSFVNFYLHQCLRQFAISDNVVGIHSEDEVMAFIA